MKNKNKLIAEFMLGQGLVKVSNNIYSTVNELDVPDDSLTVEDLQYHTSWEWLMPVVEKIETIQLPTPSMVKIKVEISGTSCRIHKGTWNDNREGFISKYFQPDEKGSKTESTYKAIVEFIKWYNKNKDIQDNMAHDFDRELDK